MTTTSENTRYEIHDDAGNRWTQVVRAGLSIDMDYDDAVRKLRQLLRAQIGIGRLRIVRIEDARREQDYETSDPNYPDLVAGMRD